MDNFFSADNKSNKNGSFGVSEYTIMDVPSTFGKGQTEFGKFEGHHTVNWVYVIQYNVP